MSEELPAYYDDGNFPVTQHQYSEAVDRLRAAMDTGIGGRPGNWNRISEDGAWICQDCDNSDFSVHKGAHIEARIEVCGINPNGNEAMQLVEALELAAAGLRKYIAKGNP